MQAIVIDTETTGLDPECEDILQLSVIGIDGSILFNEFFKPTKKECWEEAQAVNGISPDMVINCPTFEERRGVIQQIINSVKLIISYNANFDLSFLDSHGILLPECECFDVMEAFAPIYGDWSDYHQDYKWKSLSVCAGYYDYEWEGKEHDSLEDCKATLFCYNKIINGNNEEIESRNLLEHLLYYGFDPEDFLLCIDEIEQGVSDKFYFEQYPEEATEEASFIDADIENAQDKLAEMLKGWKRCDKKDLTVAIQIVREYVAQREAKKEG